MTELASLDNYQGSEPTMVPVPMPHTSAASSQQTPFYTTGSNALWRLRVLTVSGFRFVGAGGTRLGLFFDFATVALPGWNNGQGDSPITATVPQDITGSDNFNYTWS